MNDNRNLITHITTDPNAGKHIMVGLAVSIVALLVVQTLYAPLAASFAAGVGIEIVQRLEGGTNSNRESIMDVLTTTVGGIPAFLLALL